MNTTIPESEYQDCVEELSVKLSAERKLNSDKNTRIAELEEQIGRMVALIVAFSFYLESSTKAYNEESDKWYELKAQHLDSTEMEAD